MIRIVMEGMCEGCKHADLEIACIYFDGGEKWVIRCVHEFACYDIQEKCREDGDNDG